MLKHLNGLLCLQFQRPKWVLHCGKIEWNCGIKSFTYVCFSCSCPDTSRLDISPTHTSPTDTSPTGQFPDRHFPDLAFPLPDICPSGYFPDWTFPRPDISPSGYFPDCIFPQLHISPFYTYFRADISLTLNNLFLTGYFWQFKCRKCLNFLVNEW